MAVTISVLRAELLSSVFASTYSAAIADGSHNAVADRVNSYASAVVSVGTVYAIDMQQAVVASEYAVLSGGQRDLWNAVVTTGVNGVAISNTALRAQVAFVWSAGTTTRASLLALDTKRGSRCEFLFGNGVVVTATDVQQALQA
jgi:hypothetical protein